MNAVDQRRLGEKLEAALAAAGLVIERPVTEGSNVRGWEPVSGEELIGRLMSVSRWRVRERPDDLANRPPLRLLEDWPLHEVHLPEDEPEPGRDSP